MALLQKTRGIVLQRRFLQEADGIARLLCESGESLEFRAYGIRQGRRRSALLIEPGALITIDYYAAKNRMAALKEGHIENRFEVLKQNYGCMLLLAYVLEMTAFASSYGGSGHLFLLLHGSLQELCRCHKRLPETLRLLVFFQVRLLRLLGILGPQERCSQCDGLITNKAHWNLPEAHFSCESCAPQSDRDHWQDALMAQIVSLASARRFHDFVGEIKKKQWKSEKEQKLFLTLWDSLHFCLESFAGKPFSSSGPLRNQYEQKT